LFGGLSTHSPVFPLPGQAGFMQGGCMTGDEYPSGANSPLSS
jgi:hypothetical protein